MYADYLGIPARHVSTNLSGDLDLAAFLGAPGAGRPGFASVVASVLVEVADVDEARFQELVGALRRSCPILDVFATAIPVDLVVKAAAPQSGPRSIK